MKIEFDTIDELKELISFLGSLTVNDQTEDHQNTNAERQKRYRENKKRNETVTHNVTDITETVTRNVTDVTLSQEERENEKETEEKERTKEKEDKEKVKEKEEILNIYSAEPQKPQKTPKHRHGNFQHVLLTDDEFSRIQTDFPDWPDRIQRLDDYLENNPAKHYANHNLTIRNWANRDAAEAQKQPKQIPKEKTFRDLRIEMENQAAAIAPADDFIDSFWRT